MTQEYFPNGLPRICNWYDEEDGIKYVPGKDGEMHPVLDDHWIVCDTKKSYVVNTYYPEPAWGWDDSAPIKIEMYSEYHSNEEEAMEDAEAAQRRLEEEGRFIPIYHRN